MQGMRDVCVGGRGGGAEGSGCAPRVKMVGSRPGEGVMGGWVVGGCHVRSVCVCGGGGEVEGMG